MVRDEFGFIRTHLANERTLLAYIRTALTFWAAGAALIKFLSAPAAQAAGWTLVGAGLITFAAGFARYNVLRNRINRLFS
jgi:putative membrane protein